MTAAHRLACALLALVVTALAGAPALAQRPDPSAEAALVVDARNGEVLFEEGAGERHAIASATKLMTALLALERAEPDDVFRAPAYDASPVESKIDLRRGERMKVEDLLEALLLESANDAAVTIAKNVSGSRRAFVRDMNERAAELGLGGTHYANPIGLDAPGNHSTARDLAALARRLLENERFADIVDMPQASLESGARTRTVENRNALVRRVPWVDGVKTGHTANAGYVLVGSAHRRGAHVVSVVLGAPSESARDESSLALLRWGLRRFKQVHALTQGRELVRVNVDDQDEDAVLTTPRTLPVTIRKGERLERRLHAPDEVDGPLPAGREVGTVDVLYRGRVIRSAPLVTADDVPEPSTLEELEAALQTLAISLALIVGGIAAALVVLRVRALRMRRERGAPKP